MTEVTVRPFAPGDEAGINASFNRAFGLNRPLEDWFWKFPTAPFGRFIWVAISPQGEVLAHYAAIPVRLQVAGKEVLAGQGVDAFAVPEVQGQRLYTRTVREFYGAYGGETQLALSYVFPGPRSARIFTQRLDFTMLGEPWVWRRTLDHRRARCTGYEVIRVTPDGRLDALWQAAAARYPVAAVRDAAWLGRRFAGRPGVDYLHLAAVRRKELHAWAVVRVEASRVAWAELVWDGARPAAVAALERAVTEVARRAGVPTLELWLERDEAAAEVLRHYGWRRVPPAATMFFAARSFSPEVKVADLSRLYITMGDADLV